MLICLVIAAELALLYTVFWYFYVREPKPFKIVGNPWGKYGETGFTAGGIDPTLPFTIPPPVEDALVDSRPVQGPTKAASLDVSPMAERPRKTPSCRRRNRYHHRACEARPEPILSRLLSILNRTMEGLNVRLP